MKPATSTERSKYLKLSHQMAQSTTFDTGTSIRASLSFVSISKPSPWADFSPLGENTRGGFLSSFISDGYASQHLQYLPFGETFVDQRNTTYNTPFKFSAKEKDEETGYSYFGARYYWPEVSVWLSVDPLSDQYPSTSPYMYCLGNPIVLIDPDGREVEGFSIDNDGNVQIDKEKASQDAIRVYESMSMTETGTQAFKDMVTMETQITFEITDQAIYSGGKQVYGKTEGNINDLTEKGEYKTAKITISTADAISDPNSRYNGFSDNEKINGIGTHERVHLNSRQINIDHGKLPSRYKEQRPVMLEYKTRMEYRQKYGQEGDRNIKQNYENYLYKRNWKKVN